MCYRGSLQKGSNNHVWGVCTRQSGLWRGMGVGGGWLSRRECAGGTGVWGENFSLAERNLDGICGIWAEFAEFAEVGWNLRKWAGIVPELG